MSANLLETRTQSYLELVGNGRIYTVPPYQRDYSWGEDQWEDLWQDLMDLRTGASQNHYLGAIVVEKASSDREFRVIDGQQRLATLSLVALAIIGRLRELASQGVEPAENQERAISLRNRFIGEKDPASLLEQSKLSLNQTDNSVFQDYLVQGREVQVPKRLPKSNQLLVSGLRWFRAKVSQELGDDGGEIAGFLSNTVARQLLFILILVSDEASAYTVFETLNARGLELSTTDLLKNYLFSKVAPVDVPHLQRRWASLLQLTSQEKFPDFLRYHYLTGQTKVRKERLFKAVREQVRGPQAALDLVGSLEPRASLYAALQDHRDVFWEGQPLAAEAVRVLRIFGVKQFTPLVFSAYEALEREAFGRVLQMISVISFRYSIVSQMNTNALEPVYSRAAIKISKGKATTPKAIFNELSSVYIPDEKFVEDFSILSMNGGGRSKIAKYVLCRLESHRRGSVVSDLTDPGTVEHIYPQSSSEYEANAEEWDAYVGRLGNLTLLEASINRSFGSERPASKLPKYQGSAYAITQELAAYEEWLPELVEARQRQMARDARTIWRCDY